MQDANTNTVMLATSDEDVCLCTLVAMDEVGQMTANQLGCTVTARDPVSDDVIKTFEPSKS